LTNRWPDWDKGLWTKPGHGPQQGGWGELKIKCGKMGVKSGLVLRENNGSALGRRGGGKKVFRGQKNPKAKTNILEGHDNKKRDPMGALSGNSGDDKGSHKKK